MRAALALVAAVLLSAVACAGSGSRVVVLAASSLTDVTTALGDASGVGIDVSAAGSHVLAQQVRSGAPAAVLLLADPDLAEALADEGVAGPPVTVATTGLAIAVRSDRSEAVRGPADLALPELRVVLADESVPLGRYTREGLEAAEDAGAIPAGATAEILAGVDSLEDAARSVLAKVTTGQADAAVVFASDQRLAPDLVFIPWPTDVEARYTVQTVGDASTEAERFAAFVRSEAAASVWQRYGFTPR